MCLHHVGRLIYRFSMGPPPSEHYNETDGAGIGFTGTSTGNFNQRGSFLGSSLGCNPRTIRGASIGA